MNLVFCLDHLFVREADGCVYSAGQFSHHTWERYLAFSDRLTVVSRSRAKKPAERSETLNLVSADRVSFRFQPSLSSLPSVVLARRGVARELAGIIADSDAVIGRLPSEIGMLAVEIAESLGKPWAVELVACPWDALWNHGSLAAKLYAPLMAARVRRTVRKARFCLYVTEQFLQSRYPCLGATASVSNVQIEPSNPSILDRRLDRIANSPRPLVVGQIGSLQTSTKGVQVALRALAHLRGRVPDFEYRVLGPGDPLHWRSLASGLGIDDLVHFDGTLPSGSLVMEWLDGIDLYLQPSFQEGLPRTLIEAMSRGCPALGSTAGGIPELMPPERLHKPGDWRHLSRTIAATLTSATLRKELARRNFEKAEHYVADRLNAQRAAFLRKFVATAVSGRR